MTRLKEQVVLITGCSTGIGRALAGEFAHQGHRVFASARRIETLRALSGEGVEALALDVTDEKSIDAAVSSLIERAGRIDIVVNNAGVNVFGPLPELPLGEFRRLLETNLTGPLAIVERVFPHMAEQRSGRIVNIGSVAGILPTPFAGAYCATKAALHMLSTVLRMEVAPFGIDVIVVQPGAVRSNISESGAQGIERYAQETSRFRAVYKQIEKRAWASQRNPMDTNQFAAAVVEAVTQQEAPRVVRLGGGAAGYIALSRLPAALLDRVMTRQFRLDQLRVS
jgi:NAD(P)-dependent dehydrogenase (short-subunit alcohol dehydrogenase family)